MRKSILLVVLACFAMVAVPSCDKPDSPTNGRVTFESLTGYATDHESQRTNLGLSDLLILHDLNAKTVRVRGGVWNRLSNEDKKKVTAVFQRSQDENISGKIKIIVE